MSSTRRARLVTLQEHWGDFNARVSEYFTVGEVCNYEIERIPISNEIKRNCFRLAAQLDIVRARWGGPVMVSSWYRPPAVNTRIGGARNSQHLLGLAADIYPGNGEGRRFEQFLDAGPWANRALGYGQASGRGFTHVDLREGRIRWFY